MKPVERLASFYFIFENNDLNHIVKMMAEWHHSYRKNRFRFPAGLDYH